MGIFYYKTDKKSINGNSSNQHILRLLIYFSKQHKIILVIYKVKK